jgi:RNA polymerase sigma-70 factor (ECF subfamily)
MKAHSKIAQPAQSPAFAALLEAHLPQMRPAALRYTRNIALAEDLVHDTAVRALRFQSSFVMGTNFKAWMHTVMTHTFINRYRRQKREQGLLTGASRQDVIGQLRSDEAFEAAQAPEQYLTRNLLSDTVVHALTILPEDFRKVVVMCDLEGLSYRDAAQALHCPLGTVMSRLHRGRRMLKVTLKSEAQAYGLDRLVEQHEAQAA